MRGHSTNPAAIEAEIAHLRSLALDALRRHWRVIFGRTPPAELSKDLWQGATYPSLSAIARAITGTAWSGPRFFALARGNGAPARRNKNASAREGRDGSQPARGMNASEMNTASLPLQTASHT